MKRREALGVVASAVAGSLLPYRAGAAPALNESVEEMRSVSAVFNRRFGIVSGVATMVMVTENEVVYAPIPRPPDDQFIWTASPSPARSSAPRVHAQLPVDDLVAVMAFPHLAITPVWLFRKSSGALYLFRFFLIERVGETRAIDGMRDVIGMYPHNGLTLVRADLTEVSMSFPWTPAST